MLASVLPVFPRARERPPRLPAHHRRLLLPPPVTAASPSSSLGVASPHVAAASWRVRRLEPAAGVRVQEPPPRRPRGEHAAPGRIPRVGALNGSVGRGRGVCAGAVGQGHMTRGEIEYGIMDMFYAAARGGSADVFRLLLDHAMSSRCSTNCRNGKGGAGRGFGFWLEIMSRAIHAAARGGSMEMLKELLEEGRSSMSMYFDFRGSTVLHAAAGRGQLQYRRSHSCLLRHGAA